MKKSLYISMLLSFMFLCSCSSDDVGDGSECSACKSDSNCNEGMTCQGFFNSSGVYERCSTYSCGVFGCSGTSSC